MWGLSSTREQAGSVDEALGAARRSADLAQKLYAAGRSSYLDLLDAQRNLASIDVEEAIRTLRWALAHAEDEENRRQAQVVAERERYWRDRRSKRVCGLFREGD